MGIEGRLKELRSDLRAIVGDLAMSELESHIRFKAQKWAAVYQQDFIELSTLKRELKYAQKHGKLSIPVNVPLPIKPTVVCLCGSTRFSEAYQKANLTETLAGKIVLTIGCDMRSDTALFEGKSEAELEAIKAGLDELHLRKIDLADEILVLNVGGYVGNSTRREIEYAQSAGKAIRWLEGEAVQS